MIIDAKDTILGRLCSKAAKMLLLGEKVDVINCGESVVTGNKSAIMNEYLTRLHRKAPTKGPYFYKRPDFFVKRAIRGMLPFKHSRGREAFKNLKCHIGVPGGLKGEKSLDLKIGNIDKLSLVHYMRVKDICRGVGGKV